MEVINITIPIILAVVAYILGAITKLFIYKIPNRYIPIQNLIVGFISAFICYFSKVEPNLLSAIVTCLMATMGAGGLSDLIDGIRNKE